MNDILDQIITATKKFPGNAVGAPVDVINLILGAVAGKGTEGLSKQPVGGSAQINKMFGLGESKGTVEDITSLVQSFLSPGGAAKAAIGGVVVPAQLIKKFSTIKEANKALEAGQTSEAVFNKTGIYKVPTDDILRAVVSDEGAKLKPESKSVIRQLSGYQSSVTPGPNVHISTDMFSKEKLSDILDHPELYKLIPELQDVPVKGGFLMGEGAAAYTSKGDILMGNQRSEREYLSTLLHEVQHAIQSKYGMTGGGNPGMFKDSESLKAADSKLSDMISVAKDNLVNAAAKVDKKTYYRDAKFEGLPEYKALEDLEYYKTKLSKVDSKAFEEYLKLGGEAEARYVSNAFKKDVPTKTLPTKEYDVDVAKTTSPESVIKVDDDPVVKAIYETLQALNPTK